MSMYALSKCRFSGYSPDGRRTPFKKGDAPDPDPNIGLSAQRQIELAERQYEDYKNDYAPFLKEQMRQSLDISADQNKRATEMQTYQLGRAQLMDKRYDSVQIPLEDDLIAKARAYNEADEQERMARTAGEDVATAFNGAEGRIMRGLAARGVRAGSGASMAALGGLETQRALAEVSAINKTRQAAKDIGWTRLGEAAALGRGLPSFGSTSAGLSLSAGQQAFATGTSGVGLVGQASGVSNSSYSAGGGLYSGAAGSLNSQYAAQSSGGGGGDGGGWGALVGGVAGSFFGPMGTAIGSQLGKSLTSGGGSTGGSTGGSDVRLKFDIRRIGQTGYNLPIYTFRYKHDPEQLVVGVMAHEVAVVRPEAYIPRGFDGVHDAVDYSKL